MVFRASQFSGTGGKPKNEDACMFGQRQGFFVAAVADGLGGHGGGDLAAEAALGVVAAAFDKLFPWSSEKIEKLFYDMNEAVLEKQADRLKMKSTAALFLTDGSSSVFAHLGDSRIYHFRGGAILYQSLDHSASQLAASLGDITPGEIRFHEDRNILLRCLGNEGEVKPAIRLEEGALFPGDTLLLCTDGFWEYVTEDEMLETRIKSGDPDTWLAAMTAVIDKKAQPGHDNYTAVAVFCD
jgi:serine/threonine protein phosphatase PrpC